MNVEIHQYQVSESSLLWCAGHKCMCEFTCVIGIFSKEDNLSET